MNPIKPNCSHCGALKTVSSTGKRYCTYCNRKRNRINSALRRKYGNHLSITEKEAQGDYGGLTGHDVAELLGISYQAEHEIERKTIRRLWRDSLLLSNIKDRFEKEGLV
jgi:hypothetical protein